MEKRGVPAQVSKEYCQVKKYVESIREHVEAGVGLILKGPVGTMKTSLAVAVLQHYIQVGGYGLFVPMASLLDNIFTLKERNKEEWLRYEDRIRSTGILVLDDLGAEYHQEWVLSKVDAIISERYNRMKPIIITTNLSAKELKGKYAERVYDRLKSTSKVINFAGSSLRESA
ncbi:ATP-binding protein [Sporomusa sphaeroides]|uniref:ATP-binding protein n=1 Tax=Sporomusa sphaeroides TaxID=47679 RepID=UPI00202FADEE|nr:ATP-binding protein [Sporomusa sphaeroides]MCM0757428.1 ATP-binding protein [Sporomusa sphaeroides DSM 2875]HML33822.1 ATP-binding protein [Sporomusa sphaeroides]